VNAGAPWPSPDGAWLRVMKIQAKLHQWASDDPGRRFDDLFNLVCDPATLLLAWERVRGNKGARTAGVDGQTAFYVEMVRGVEEFLVDLRADLRAGTFRPLPVRERMIPKASGKLRRAGNPDRAGPGGPSRSQVGARADLRGGLPAVFLRLPPRTPSP
jgi:RNA-directed DNA polymerase